MRRRRRKENNSKSWPIQFFSLYFNWFHHHIFGHSYGTFQLIYINIRQFWLNWKNEIKMKRKQQKKNVIIYYASVSWSSMVCCISSGVRKSIANFFFPFICAFSLRISFCSISLTRFEYSWNEAANAYVKRLAKALIKTKSKY